MTLTTLANERNSLGAAPRGGGGKHEIHGHDLTTPISGLLARAASDVDAPTVKVRGYHPLAELAHQREVAGNAVVRQASAHSYRGHDIAGSRRSGRSRPLTQREAVEDRCRPWRPR